MAHKSQVNLPTNLEPPHAHMAVDQKQGNHQEFLRNDDSGSARRPESGSVVHPALQIIHECVHDGEDRIIKAPFLTARDWK